MDVANLLSHDPPKPSRSQQASEISQYEPQRVHQYPTRHSAMSTTTTLDSQLFATPLVHQAHGSISSHESASYNNSPGASNPKNVSFELSLDTGTNHKARLPMRVLIHPHDTTESIMTTVKNFYGLYGGATQSVGFEDAKGNILIPRYENLCDYMTVFVRVMSDLTHTWLPHSELPKQGGSPVRSHRLLQENFQMLPPQPAQILNYGESTSRPSSRITRKQSASPRPGRSRRSVSAQKGRSRSGMTSREGLLQENLLELNTDVTRGYSSSDGEGGSVTSFRKARSEQLFKADISLHNVLEGNRRKKAKFESSVSFHGLCHPEVPMVLIYYSRRNYHSLFHRKYPRRTRSPPSLHRGALMDKTIPPHSPGPTNVHFRMANPKGRRRALDLVITDMVYSHRLVYQ